MGASNNTQGLSRAVAQRLKDKKAAVTHDPYAVPRDELAAARLERDRMRRMTLRASGRDSTVRTGSQGAPYAATPKTLLGS